MSDEQRAQGESDPRAGRFPLRGPIALWAILLASFLAVVVIYAAFAEPFILKVYEMEQIDRSHGRDLSRVILDYEDYLRADPTSLRIRGRVVNALIVSRRYPDAIEHADQAIEYADQSQRPVAWLIAVRSNLAAGDVDSATGFLQHVLDLSPESGEAQFTLARIAAAKGDFTKMASAYARVRTLGTRDSSQEYDEEWETRSRELSKHATALESNGHSADSLFEYANALERLGRIDEALEFFVQASTIADAPAETIYWSGVFEEREGNRTNALNRYTQAAQMPRSYPIAAYALTRLQDASP